MRLVVQREPFLAACVLAAQACPAKDVKPILKNLHVRAAPGVCEVSATDLELGVRIAAEGVEVHEAGECLVPAGKCVDVLKGARSPVVHVSLDSESVILSGDGFEFAFAGANPDEFPPVPALPGVAPVVQIDPRDLSRRVARTTFCCAAEAQRYSMTGVSWEFGGDGEFALVATDGRRLAVCGEPPAASDSTTVVPARAMNALAKLMQASESPVCVYPRPNEIIFGLGRATLYSRLVEGRFPDWRKVAPKAGAATRRLSIDAQELLHKVRLAAFAADSESPRVTFAFAAGKLSMTAAGATSGRGRVELPIDFDGAVDVNLNPQFVCDVLKAAGEGEVLWEIRDGASPIVVRAGDDSTWLIMPLT